LSSSSLLSFLFPPYPTLPFPKTPPKPPTLYALPYPRSLISLTLAQLDRYGYESHVIQTRSKSRDFKFDSEKVVIFLIMGSFMLADGKVIGEQGVKMGDLMGKVGAGKGYLVELEEGCRVFKESAVVISYFY
jgi:hypothetical protein